MDLRRVPSALKHNVYSCANGAPKSCPAIDAAARVSTRVQPAGSTVTPASSGARRPAASTLCIELTAMRGTLLDKPLGAASALCGDIGRPCISRYGREKL